MELAARLKPWHRRNAILLGIFLAAHLITHLSALFGPDMHGGVIGLFRLIYRAPIIEPVLIVLFVSQVGMGLVMAWSRLRQSAKTAWSWIQIASGLYLALFILNHIFLGVLRGRTHDGVETGFHFVAATLITDPIRYGFIPYYLLAVVAIFAHLTAALHWRGQPDWLTRGLILTGVGAAVLIVGAYGGVFFPISLPDAYQAYLADAF